MLRYGRNWHNIVKQISPNYKKKKKIRKEIKPLFPNKDIVISDQTWQRIDRNMLVQGH